MNRQVHISMKNAHNFTKNAWVPKEYSCSKIYAGTQFLISSKNTVSNWKLYLQVLCWNQISKIKRYLFLRRIFDAHCYRWRGLHEQ